MIAPTDERISVGNEEVSVTEAVERLRAAEAKLDRLRQWARAHRGAFDRDWRAANIILFLVDGEGEPLV